MTGPAEADSDVGESRAPLRVAVIGAAGASEEEYATALELGRSLARRGAVVVCGGRGGVMEAVARGAREGGGEAVGILPGSHASEANPWVSIPLATGMGEARNALVVRAGESVVAVGGGWGTLSEIALARKMGRQVTVLGRPPAEGLDLHVSATPEEAGDWALRQAEAHRESGRE